MNRSRDTVRVPFHALLNNGFTASAQLPLTPTLTPRLTAIADDFDEFRFEKLRFRVRDVAAAAGTQVCAYLPGIVDTPPVNLAQIGEILNCVLIAPGETVASQWSDVPKGVLAGMHPWYKSVAGTPEASEEQQGVICLVETSAASTFVFIEVEGICAFRAAVNAGNTPMERALAARKRERARILSLIATPDSVVKKGEGKVA